MAAAVVEVLVPGFHMGELHIKGEKDLLLFAIQQPIHFPSQKRFMI